MRGGGSSFFPTLCCAIFLWAATWMTPVAAEDNLPVAADGNVVFLPWRCGGYVALPESEHTRRSLETAGKFGGNGLRLRGGTIFFSAFRRGPGSLQIIIGRRGGDAGDDVNDIFTSGGGPAMSPLVMMGASRGSGADFPTSDEDSSRTLRATGEDKQQQGEQPAVPATTEGPNLIPSVNLGDGTESSSDSSSSSSSSTFLDHLLSVLLIPPSHGLMRQSPFLSDPAKLLLARTHGIKTIEDGTTSWLSRSRSGSVGEDEDEDGSISEREVMNTAAAAAAEAAKAARGDSSKGWELSRQLEGDDDRNSRGGVSDDASSQLLEGGFVGNNYLDVVAPKLIHVPGVYSWRARDAEREEEGTGEEDGMFFRDVFLFPRRGEKQEWEVEEEEGGEGEGVVGILRCVKGWWRQVSTWAAGVGRSMLETVLDYQGSVEDCAVFALGTAVPMALLLLIVHVVAKCTYNDEEEEEGEEEEEDDDDDDEEGGQQQSSRTVVVVTANSVGNDDVRTPLLDNRLYRGEHPTLNADEAMMSKLEATVIDYNPPNPADMTRGV